MAIKKSFFDPHKSLLELGVIRLAASLLILAFLFSTFAISAHKELFWKFDYEGFNYAIKIFKVPFGIAALAIPIMGILAANHRSEQSREQMRLTSEQNIFSNHYKHVEEFEKYCIRVHDRIIENDKATRERYEKSEGIMKHFASTSFIPTNINSKFSRLIYKKLYPSSINGDMRLSEEFLNSFDIFVSRILVNFEAFKYEDKAKWYESISEINLLMREFVDENYIDLRYIGSPKSITINDVEIRVPGGDVMLFLRQFQDIIYAIEDVLAFDISYSPSDLVKKTTGAGFERMPEWDVDNVSSWKPVNISLYF